ncbi:hypothetical protein [Sciscionella sediminilitoris]|uniref:hypothetical protein n=1 Tax=Sciscionella sediminilitoris TaxID=1445613 RepID=UPI0004DF6BD9|nr:hypothetical protein [Sciscionella sp. SE31]
MRTFTKKVLTVLAGSAIALGVGAPVSFADTAPAQQQVSVRSAADGSPAGAVAWYSSHAGSTGWEHYCEKAAENAYGTTGVWASAIAHWNGASPKHSGDKNPPLGAFVYWKISQYGHVGVSDGKGGFWATSVGGKIGHVTKAGGGYGYFSNYLGWTPGAKPSH